MLKRLLLVVVLVFGVLFTACDAGDVASTVSGNEAYVVKNVKLADVTPANESDMFAPSKAFKLISLISDAEIGSKYFKTVEEYFKYSFIMADGTLTEWSMAKSTDGLYSVVVAGFREKDMKIYAMSFLLSLKQDGEDLKATVISHSFTEDFGEVSDEKMYKVLKNAGWIDGNNVASNVVANKETSKKVKFEAKPYDPDEAGYIISEDINFDIFVRDYQEKYDANGMVKGTKKQRALVSKIRPISDTVKVNGSGHTLAELFDYLDAVGIEYDTFLTASSIGDDTATLYIYITKNNINNLGAIFIDFDVFSMGRNLGTEFDISSVIVWDKNKNVFKDKLEEALFLHYGR